MFSEGVVLNQEFSSPVVDLNLITSVMSLYLAGTDTSSSQLYWAFLYMVLYPEVQQKIYREIREHIGMFVCLFNGYCSSENVLRKLLP